MANDGLFKIDEMDALAIRGDINDFIRKQFNIPKINPVINAAKINCKSEEDSAPKAEEKWIWIEGYKGTDGSMTCRDFKFDFGTVFSVPEGQDIRECEKGFHLCFDLKDVFSYYGVGDGNRFFKVKALVKESDYKHKMEARRSPSKRFYFDINTDKIVAKSIEFLGECSCEEVLTANRIDCSNWTLEEQLEAIQTNPHKMVAKKQLEAIQTNPHKMVAKKWQQHLSPD